jgi:iron complex outermembrane receptor protein
LIAANGNIGEVRSTGTRAAMTWGEAECTQVTAGGDFAFMDEEYVETGASYLGTFGLPRSQSHDPGLFSDAVLPINEWLSLKAGSRIDWTKISAVPGTLPQPAGDEQNFTLGAGYLSAECRLDHAWVATAGFGYAERAPTPTDLYALTFLEILQPGGDLDFRGNVNVRKEQLSQFDLGITFAYDAFRGGLHGYSGWVDDYVTYQWNSGVMRTQNTNARLSGGEFYVERDLSSGVSAFGNISYVQAKDLIRDEPLWGIPPLESRIGLRIKQVGDDPTWGMEFAVRIADDQDRIARAIFTDGMSSASLGEQVTPGFTTCDLRGYYRINRALRLVAGVENIGDRNYQEHLDARRDLTYAAPGGVFRAGVNGYMGLISTY